MKILESFKSWLHSPTCESSPTTEDMLHELMDDSMRKYDDKIVKRKQEEVWVYMGDGTML